MFLSCFNLCSGNVSLPYVLRNNNSSLVRCGSLLEEAGLQGREPVTALLFSLRVLLLFFNEPFFLKPWPFVFSSVLSKGPNVVEGCSISIDIGLSNLTKDGSKEDTGEPILRAALLLLGGDSNLRTIGTTVGTTFVGFLRLFIDGILLERPRPLFCSLTIPIPPLLLLFNVAACSVCSPGIDMVSFCCCSSPTTTAVPPSAPSAPSPLLPSNLFLGGLFFFLSFSIR